MLDQRGENHGGDISQCRENTSYIMETFVEKSWLQLFMPYQPNPATEQAINDKSMKNALLCQYGEKTVPVIFRDVKKKYEDYLQKIAGAACVAYQHFLTHCT